MQSSSILQVAAVPAIEFTPENIELFYQAIAWLAYDQHSPYREVAKKVKAKYLQYLNSIHTVDEEWPTLKKLMCEQINYLVKQDVFKNIEAGVITGIHKDIASDGKLMSLIFDINSQDFVTFVDRLSDSQAAILQSIVRQPPPLLSPRPPEYAAAHLLRVRRETVLDYVLEQGEAFFDAGRFDEAISLYTHGEAILQSMELSCSTTLQNYISKLQLLLSNAYHSYGLMLYMNNPEQATEYFRLASAESEHLPNTAENPWARSQLALMMLEQHKACGLLSHNIELACRHFENAINHSKNLINKLSFTTILKDITKSLINVLATELNVFGKHSHYEKLLLAEEIIRHTALLPNEPDNHLSFIYATKIKQEKTLFIFDYLLEKNKSLSPEAQLDYLKLAIAVNKNLDLDYNSEKAITYQNEFLRNLITRLATTCGQYDSKQIGYFTTLIKKIINTIPAASLQLHRAAYANLLKAFINQLQVKKDVIILLRFMNSSAVKNLHNDYLMIIKLYQDIPEQYLSSIEKISLTNFHQYALLFGLQAVLLDANPTSKKNINAIKKIITNHDLHIISPDSMNFHFLQQNIAGLLHPYAPLIKDFENRIYFLNFAISALKKAPASMREESDKFTLSELRKMIHITQGEGLIYTSAPVIDSTEQTNSMNCISNMINLIENSTTPGSKGWDILIAATLEEKQIAIMDFHIDYFNKLIDQLEKKFARRLHLFTQEQSELKKLFHTWLKPLKTYKCPELLDAAKNAIEEYLTKQAAPIEPLFTSILDKIQLLHSLEVYDGDEYEEAPTRRNSI